MRRLIVQEWISLDGFAADKNDRLDFFAPTVRDIYQDEYYLQYLENIDCILLGKNTYKQFSAVWPARSGHLAEKIDTSEKIVFSGSLTNAPWGQWRAASISATDLPSKIRELKSLPGKNIVIWGSLSLVRQAMKAQLIDEFHIHLCPAITGGGRRLFTHDHHAELKLIHSKHFDNGVAALHYQAQTNYT